MTKLDDYLSSYAADHRASKGKGKIQTEGGTPKLLYLRNFFFCLRF